MYEDDILEHYGVKGMKWGIRKDRDGNKKDRLGVRLSKKAVNRTKRDIADLEKHGMTEEAAGLKANLKKQERRLKKRQEGRLVSRAVDRALSTSIATHEGHQILGRGMPKVEKAVERLNQKWEAGGGPRNLNERGQYSKELIALTNKVLAEETRAFYGDKKEMRGYESRYQAQVTDSMLWGIRVDVVDTQDY
jgi:hypothetical protein